MVEEAAGCPRAVQLQQFELPEVPTLDEAWTLWLFVTAESQPQLSPQLEAMCRYVEDSRQGRWTDRVPLEASVQAVYLALAQDALLGAKNPARFLEETWALFGAVAAHLLAGKPLLDDPFLLGVPVLQRHVAALKEDHRLFTADLEQARRYEVRLPAEASITAGARTLNLLVLKLPAASQFKLWARRDGYSMLLVQQARRAAGAVGGSDGAGSAWSAGSAADAGRCGRSLVRRRPSRGDADRFYRAAVRS